jgi:DNA-directed RNA polymerase subunit alpha
MSTETEEVQDTKKVKQLGRFQLPNRLVKNEETATDVYAQFVAGPFERGYGHTLGNSLRRVLLGSLEGASITSVRIAGVMHEFSSLPGVVEDVTDIILNLKKVKFLHHDKEPRILKISVERDGIVTAGDIIEDNMYEVVNKDQLICTLDRKVKFDCEFEVRVGRGFSTGEENKRKDQAIGVIAIDSIFSPVTRVKYAVDTTRVGQMTDFDELILDIWTDGRITPQDALLQASAILRHHLDVFVNYDDKLVNFDAAPAESTEENAALKKLLGMSVRSSYPSARRTASTMPISPPLVSWPRRAKQKC